MDVRPGGAVEGLCWRYRSLLVCRIVNCWRDRLVCAGHFLGGFAASSQLSRMNTAAPRYSTACEQAKTTDVSGM